MTKACDWCGAPSKVIDHKRWLWNMWVYVVKCIKCHHEWEESAPPKESNHKDDK